MEQARTYWPRWAAALRRYRLSDLAVAILEVSRPIAFLSAQLALFSRGFFDSNEVGALAELLEDDSQARDFARYLSQE
jgi:hypothetical protein